VNGEDYPGAVAETLTILAHAEINVGCGAGYGTMIFLRQAGIRKTDKLLGIH
jgi:hypothetical protein